MFFLLMGELSTIIYSMKSIQKFISFFQYMWMEINKYKTINLIIQSSVPFRILMLRLDEK